MRISRVQLAGLVMVIAAGAKGAWAADVTVSTSTTTPLQTSSPDGASPGNVTVASGGSIAVTAGQTAVTVNSSNNVSNAGTLSSNNADNTRGVVLRGGFSGTVTNTGSINLLEDYTQSDADTDGDLDGAVAIGANRIGIFLESGPAFTGKIDLQSGAISVEGNNSAGVRLDAQLIGDLNVSSVVTVVGNNSQAIAINGGTSGGVTGDVTVRGSVSVRGENSYGIYSGGVIGGALNIGGSVIATAYNSTIRPTLEETFDELDADDLRQSGAAVAVRNSVGEGLTFLGIGVEDDDDDDGDGVKESDTTPDADDDAGASVQVFGGAPAVWIAPTSGGANVALGATATGHGVRNRGSISASGVYDGFDATAIRIEGLGGSTVTTAGGVLNDGTLAAVAYEAEAYGLYVGAGATTPEVNNRRTITVRSTSETDQTAYGVYYGAGATAGTLKNSGVVSAQFLGELGDAVAIADKSNTLSLIVNSGTIQSQVLATDDDATDDEVPEATGAAIAIDVSASSIGVTLRQEADVVFNDDDADDDDVNARPPVRIVGDILFGSGADRLELLAGDIAGALSFGAGADSLLIANGAAYAGRISDSDGALSINVQDGALGLAGGLLNITSATFGAESELAVLLTDDAAETTRIVASGAVTFAQGATITPVIPTGLPDSGSQIFLTALGGLNGEEYVSRTITGQGAPWIYNLSVGVAQSDANSLEASYQLKTAEQLGMNANQYAAFNPIVEALRLDDEASAAMASVITEDAFFDAYQDMLPNYSSAAAELAATAIQQSQGASANRLASTRLRDVEHVSVWAQEIGYSVNREPETALGVEYRGHGFGLAFGIDGPLENGALFGLAASFLASEVEEPGRVEGEIAASFGQFNAYLGTGMGPIDLDFVVGGGLGKLKSARFVAIGETFEGVSEAEWWAYEGHGSVRASAPQRLASWLTLTPYAGLTYVALAEEAYEEEGGGAALDLSVDDTVSQRLWADIGVDFGARVQTGGGAVFTPYVGVGYRANAISEAADRTLRFVSGGDDFTLTDDELGSGAPLLSLGVDATNGYSTFSIAYEGEFGEQIDRHSLNAALRFRF